MTQLATMTMHGTVAVVTLDSPPVNALSTRLRAAACAALGEALAAPGCAAVVLACAGTTFIAGADISEFDQAEQEPSFDALLALVEDAPVPVVAAIHGTALGGGFELALACHYRVAVAGARVGLPEVHLGILPGAGGTQRLPRLTGAATALDIITSGRHVGAAEAHELGMIDAIVPGDDLVGGAIAFAEQVIAAGGARPRVRDREDRIAADRGQPGLFAAFLEKNAARFKGLA
ncbi:MAG: enoyl-CoA hydratase/isomerase family protein, partial [Sphingomonadales bacterium]|nr:enoyl-CoA hydratase/isomerase family protein [Sphingomonadales bacterium]